MKVISPITQWLLILALPLLLITASIGFAVNSQWLYQYGFEKYNVGQTTGLDSAQLEATASGLISYLNSAEDTISLTVIKNGQPFILFNEQEIAHLRDVKGLIWLDYWMLLGSASYALGYAGITLYRKKYRRLARGLVGGGSITLGLILVLGLAAIMDFDQFFLQFHLISFANDLWLLDPARDYLIMLFPRGFWVDVARIVALIASGLALVLAGAGGGYLIYVTRKINNKPQNGPPKLEV